MLTHYLFKQPNHYKNAMVVSIVYKRNDFCIFGSILIKYIVNKKLKKRSFSKPC